MQTKAHAPHVITVDAIATGFGPCGLDTVLAQPKGRSKTRANVLLSAFLRSKGASAEQSIEIEVNRARIEIKRRIQFFQITRHRGEIGIGGVADLTNRKKMDVNLNDHPFGLSEYNHALGMP